MGQYINIGNAGFRSARKGEYIDKSGLIGFVNGTLGSERRFSCVSRARRFGKSMAAKMLCAYYDQSCQSRDLFADLKIAGDPSFEEHLNKYPVIYLDVTDFTTRDIPRSELAQMIQRRVKDEILAAYPKVVAEQDDDLMDVLSKANMLYGMQFIMIIDEWDAICREALGNEEAMDKYVNLLRRLFKGSNTSQVFAAVYMTGILPIKKYDTQSALNNFTEYSMIDPRRMAPYFGFTKEEVMALAGKYGMDYGELEKWYDGYQIGDQTSMFNPNSVMQAIDAGRCHSYWGRTGAYDAVASYIKMRSTLVALLAKNYEGLKDDIIAMLGGERVKVDATTFGNDMKEVHSRDDVLTVLIHLGYLSYDWNREECYIPNREVADEMTNAVKAVKWNNVIDALQVSEQLLGSLLRGDAEAVARGIEAAHDESTSILSYNNENSLACVLSLAFYAARNDYVIHREYATGRGFADLVLLPRKHVDSPAIVIELKYNHTAKTALDQIKEKHYPAKLLDYTGDVLLAGINYDRETKQHTCLIEQWKKD